MKEIGKTFTVFGLLVTAVLGMGCTLTPTPEGKWQGSVPAGQGVTATETIEFQKAGTVTQTIDMPNASMKMTGTYKVNDRKITFRFEETSITTQGGTVSASPGKVGEYEAPYAMKGDSMTLTIKEKAITLKRIK